VRWCSDGQERTGRCRLYTWRHLSAQYMPVRRDMLLRGRRQLGLLPVPECRMLYGHETLLPYRADVLPKFHCMLPE